MKPQALLDHVSTLTASFKAAEKLYADQLAPAFNPFTFIETDELGLSRILGWLLDPSANHAQGGRFLQALTTHLSLPWQPQNCEKANVTLEASTTFLTRYRRIDVLVVSNGQAIAIENKPAAADQPNQVQDYFTHLDQHYPSRNHLIYLSGDGRGPDATSLAKNAQALIKTGQLIVRSYSDLLPWLDTCRALCRAPRVGAFIADFQGYIRRRFLGERNMTERDNLVSDISSSPARIAAAMQLYGAMDALRKKLIEMLEEQLTSQASSRGWTLLPETQETAQWSGFRLRFGTADKAYFKLEFGDRYRSGSTFGIWGVKPADADYAKLQKAITAACGRGRASHASPWFRTQSLQDAILPVVNNWHNSEEPWVAIADGTLASKIIGAAQEFYDVLKPEKLVGLP